MYVYGTATLSPIPGPTKVNAEHEFIITHYCEKSFDFFLLFSPFCECWKSFLSSVKGYTESNKI